MAFTEKIKSIVRKKRHHTCCLCRNIGVEVHHIIPQEENGTDTLDNAAPLCPTCHETFGLNSSKRKMIREARNLWYELCEKRYKSDGDRIAELQKTITNLAEDMRITNLKDEISSAVVERLINTGIIKDGKGKGMPIGQLLEKIMDFRKKLKVSNQESVDVTYAFLFESIGDETFPHDKDYNEFRRKFLEYFGRLVAQNICVYLVHTYKIDWKRGVSEPDLNSVMNENYAIMFMLLYHEDVSTSDVKLWVYLNDNLDFVGCLKESKKTKNKKGSKLKK